MRKRILASAGITLTVLGILYDLRPVTFAVWTNAAMINHSYPLLVVSSIELLIGAGIFAAAYVIYGIVQNR